MVLFDQAQGSSFERFFRMHLMSLLLEIGSTRFCFHTHLIHMHLVALYTLFFSSAQAQRADTAAYTRIQHQPLPHTFLSALTAVATAPTTAPGGAGGAAGGAFPSSSALIVRTVAAMSMAGPPPAPWLLPAPLNQEGSCVWFVYG